MRPDQGTRELVGREPKASHLRLKGYSACGAASTRSPTQATSFESSANSKADP